MTTIIKTGVNNFFVNIDGSVSMQYNPAFNEYFLYQKKDEKVRIKTELINVQKGGQIYFRDGENKVIIDDGYRNKMIMAGYLYLNLKDEDIIETEYRRQHLIEALSDLSLYENYKIQSNTSDSNGFEITLQAAGYMITVDIISINKLVSTNLRRCGNKLPMYPTQRGMSKHSALYFKIYAQKMDTTKVSKSPEELYNICKNIIYSAANMANLSKIQLELPNVKDELKLFINECPVKGIILKWEVNL